MSNQFYGLDRSTIGKSRHGSKQHASTRIVALASRVSNWLQKLVHSRRQVGRWVKVAVDNVLRFLHEVLDLLIRQLGRLLRHGCVAQENSRWQEGLYLLADAA